MINACICFKQIVAQIKENNNWKTIINLYGSCVLMDPVFLKPKIARINGIIPRLHKSNKKHWSMVWMQFAFTLFPVGGKEQKEATLSFRGIICLKMALVPTYNVALREDSIAFKLNNNNVLSPHLYDYAIIVLTVDEQRCFLTVDKIRSLVSCWFRVGRINLFSILNF